MAFLMSWRIPFCLAELFSPSVLLVHVSFEVEKNENRSSSSCWQSSDRYKRASDSQIYFFSNFMVISMCCKMRLKFSALTVWNADTSHPRQQHEDNTGWCYATLCARVSAEHSETKKSMRETLFDLPGSCLLNLIWFWIQFYTLFHKTA